MAVCYEAGIISCQEMEGQFYRGSRNFYLYLQAGTYASRHLHPSESLNGF